EATDSTDPKPYDGSKWEEVRSKKPDWEKQSAALDKLTNDVPGIEKAAKDLNATIGKDEKDRRAELTRFRKTIKDAAVNKTQQPLADLWKAVDTVALGVIGEGTDSKFKLTADELVTDPKKVAERLKDRLKAMQENAKQLEENAKNLDLI